MGHFCENISQKQPDTWEDIVWILHHDDAPSHKAVMVVQFIANNCTNVIKLNLTQSDLKKKMLLLGKRI